MFWVAFKGYNNGKAISLGTIEQAEAEAYGMHGYPTEAEAEAKPNSVNALEKTQVNAWIVAANDITGNPVNDLKHAASSVANLTGINAIGDFFSRLTSANTWLRLGEGLLGIILIAVGFARISHAVPVATKIAKTVGAAGVAA